MKNNSFEGIGDVMQIKFGKSQKEGGGAYCFLTVNVDVPEEEGSVPINCVAFENTDIKLWSVIEQLNNGDCIEISGYLHARKQTDDRFKDESGRPASWWAKQLVLKTATIL